jgi:hypothetical protein
MVNRGSAGCPLGAGASARTHSGQQESVSGIGTGTVVCTDPFQVVMIAENMDEALDCRAGLRAARQSRAWASRAKHRLELFLHS